MKKTNPSFVVSTFANCAGIRDMPGIHLISEILRIVHLVCHSHSKMNMIFFHPDFNAGKCTTGLNRGNSGYAYHSEYHPCISPASSSCTLEANVSFEMKSAFFTIEDDHSTINCPCKQLASRLA